MAALVVDASLAGAWCFPDEQTDYTKAALLTVRGSGAMVPRLWAYEIRNSVLVGMRRGRIDKSHAQAFLDSLSALPVRLTDPPSYDAVFERAERYGLTVYDTAYVDLALREGLMLATLDGKMQRAAQQSGVTIFQL